MEYLDAVVAWALACLRGSDPRAARADVERLSVGRPVIALAERFGLDERARRILELLYAAERSLPVSREARAASGRSARGVTLEVARDALGDRGVDAALGLHLPLRRHALVATPDEGAVGATSELRLAPGLAARLDGAAPDSEGLAPGIRFVPQALAGNNDWALRYPPTLRITEVVKESLAATDSRLVALEGCGPRDALAVAVAIGRWLGRSVIAVDGEAVAPLASRALLLACARRDADLDGHVLLVYAATRLAEAWRAVAARPAEGLSRPTLVLLCDARPPEVTALDGLRLQTLVLHALPAAAAGAPVAAPAPVEKKKDEDGFETIRQMALRDAERAMGIVRQPPPAPPKLVAPVVQAAPPTVSAPPTPAPPEPSAPPVAAVAPPAPAAPVTATQPVAATPPAADAAPPVRRKRSKKAIEHFGPDPEDLEPPPAPPPPVITLPQPAPSPSPSSDASGAALPSVPDGPYLPLSEKPTLEELVRVCNTSPSAKQRIELIQQFHGIKSPSVVATLRLNAKSEHPGVRAAAEAIMGAMFGEHWNRQRAIPAPVQPPRTDDKDRGPPGGW